MLKINNLTITTHKGRVLLKDFSFVLNDGDKIALIGEEGNGKSTILKVLAGLDVSDYVSHTGMIVADGRIAYLPQTIGEVYLDTDTVSYISIIPYRIRMRSLIAFVLNLTAWMNWCLRTG